RQPMHQAAQNGNLETVKVLIDAGAKATPEDDSFDTDTPSPFWLACAAGKLDIVELLLKPEHKANVNFAVGRSGKTALHAAAYGGRTEIARLLLEKGCNIDAKEEDGWTALMIAAQEGHLPFLNLL
ncbi:ankyrin repeat-containing domain protein, partial [Lasiosphaeris hirsuta]